LAPEPAQARKGVDVGFLQDVFRVGIVSHDAARDAVEPLVVAFDDQPYRVTIFLPRQSQEPVVFGDQLRSTRGHFNPRGQRS
jgi:hypothetical protein